MKWKLWNISVSCLQQKKTQNITTIIIITLFRLNFLESFEKANASLKTLSEDGCNIEDCDGEDELDEFVDATNNQNSSSRKRRMTHKMRQTQKSTDEHNQLPAIPAEVIDKHGIKSVNTSDIHAAVKTPKTPKAATSSLAPLHALLESPTTTPQLSQTSFASSSTTPTTSHQSQSITSTPKFYSQQASFTSPAAGSSLQAAPNKRTSLTFSPAPPKRPKIAEEGENPPTTQNQILGKLIQIFCVCIEIY